MLSFEFKQTLVILTCFKILLLYPLFQFRNLKSTLNKLLLHINSHHVVFRLYNLLLLNEL